MSYRKSLPSSRVYAPSMSPIALSLLVRPSPLSESFDRLGTRETPGRLVPTRGGAHDREPSRRTADRTSMRVAYPVRIVLTVLTCALICSDNLAAQASGSPTVRPDEVREIRPLPRVQGGISVGVTSDDSKHRLPGGRTDRWWIATIDGGVAVSERIGVSAEFVRWPEARATSSPRQDFHTSSTQREWTLVGLIRTRVTASQRAAVDVLAGGGILRRSSDRVCRGTCGNAGTASLLQSRPVVALGADVPIRVGPHATVGWFARWYALRRGEQTTASQGSAFGQFGWSPSTRVTLGASLHVNW
jgi:hypothetical protein